MLQKRNPVLEKIRDDGLRDELIRNQVVEAVAEELAERLDRVHAAFLFPWDRERNTLLISSQQAVQNFCWHMSSSPAGILDNAWNALAVGLGFHPLQVLCVRERRLEDATYVILMSYAARPEALLGNLIRELKKIQRLDAFTAVQEELESLAAKLENRTDDSGVDCPETEPTVIYPPHFKQIQKFLNSRLDFTMKQLEERNAANEAAKVAEPMPTRRREENRVQGSAVVRRTRVAPKCNVFLTFAEDGAELAKRIAQTFRKAQGKRPQIGVLMLDDQREKVEENPENFIMHYFEKMNYIIPVLTEGYMNAISGKENPQNGITGSLDAQYVHYIKDLSNKYYMSNWCNNAKIRCVVPKDRLDILYHKHRKLDPIMKAYVYDTEIEALARRITCTYED